MKKIVLLLSSLVHGIAFSQLPPLKFEQSKGKETPTYFEIIDWWKKADAASGKIKLLTMGMTDAGQPLHLAVVARNGDYNFADIRKSNKRVILINNGIHPGEPDGIDASMLLVRDIVANKISLPDNVVLAIIPVYNIGGCLNRSTNYRVDQNGPEAFGFRGNSQNFDLNRDFIKADSKEALAFTEIFHLTQPDILIDNHVSNGADYQHVMTLLTSQHNKLGGAMGEFLNKEMEPAIYSAMKAKGYDLIPYVNFFGGRKVEDGWSCFWDAPRYSSGYAALWNTFSFMPETHMLKPYDQRVHSTHALMQSFIEFTAQHSATIQQLRNTAIQTSINQQQFPVKWVQDRSQPATITFYGYESGNKNSEISGLPRLYYDRSKPFTKAIPYYNRYNPVAYIEKPVAYILPQGWWKVVDRLQANKVIMLPLKKDTLIQVEVYKIEEYKNAGRPYEGHHLNTAVKTSSSIQTLPFRKGDWYIPLNQPANRFLIETLEPTAEDSYFAWNFFDAILGQKEGYAAYVFEDIAADYLKANASVQEKLRERKQTDTSFAKSASAQLNFVYQHSPWLEPDYLRYPVYRVK